MAHSGSPLKRSSGTQRSGGRLEGTNDRKAREAQKGWVGVVRSSRRRLPIRPFRDQTWTQHGLATEVLHRQTLSSSLRRLGNAARDTILVEKTVSDGSPFAGRTVAEAAWPPGSVVVSIQRGSHLLFPGGGTVLEPPDVVSVPSRPDNPRRCAPASGGRSPRARERPPAGRR